MSLLKPDDLIRGVAEITPEFLAARGLRGLLLDLDNTLVPYHSYDDHPGSVRWVRRVSAPLLWWRTSVARNGSCT